MQSKAPRSAELMDELNRKRAWVLIKCHCSWISWLSFVIIDNRMLQIITSVFIVTRRLKKHSDSSQIILLLGLETCSVVIKLYF